MENLPFGDLLKAFRKRQRVKQQELARRMGKHLNTIGTWERGECLPNGRSMVLEIARALHLNDQETRQLLEASLTGLAPYWYVPHRRNPFFTGRAEILDTLYTHLYPHRATTLTQSCALYGLGGIGKTQLAVEYAHRHALEYQAIFWIDAESSETITRSFLQIERRLPSLSARQETNPQYAVDAVHRWLTFHNNWLLIWDNVSDPELLQSFLPLTCQGAMLLTTSRQAIGTMAHMLEVPPMPLDEGMQLLLRRAKLLPDLAQEEHLHQLALSAPAEHTAARELVLLMGGLPLALDQVGAYKVETKCSLSDYLQHYQQQQMHLLKRRGVSGGHPHSVTTTFMLAIQQIKREHPKAADLLQLCTFLYADAIPEEIFTPGTPSLASALRSTTENILLLNEALAVLGNYSLLQRQPSEKILSIHRLVQAVLQESLEESERYTWAERAVLAVNEAFPYAGYTTWSQCERLLPQALTMLQLIEQYHLVSEEARQLRARTTFYLRNRVRYTEAVLSFQQARGIHELLPERKHFESEWPANSSA